MFVFEYALNSLLGIHWFITQIFIPGPPGPPGGLRIEDIRATSVALTWSRGSDNHSPISKYTIQSKTILSDDWKDAKTGKFYLPN